MESNMSDLSWKVNLDLWDLFIVIRFNIPMKYNDFSFNSFQTIYFSDFSPIKMHLRSKFDWDVK